MFKELNKGSKVGLVMQTIAGVIMAILVICDKPIPDFVAWIFNVALILTIVPAFLTRNSGM